MLKTEKEKERWTFKKEIENIVKISREILVLRMLQNEIKSKKNHQENIQRSWCHDCKLKRCRILKTLTKGMKSIKLSPSIFSKYLKTDFSAVIFSDEYRVGQT